MHAVWSLVPFTHVPHTWARARTRTLCARRHTDIPVGRGGGARYYQLIFAVLFLLQRVGPYVSLSATAFNLLLASAVKTSNLNCWFDSKSMARLGAECVAYDVYKTCRPCRSWREFYHFSPRLLAFELRVTQWRAKIIAFFQKWFFSLLQKIIWSSNSTPCF